MTKTHSFNLSKVLDWIFDLSYFGPNPLIQNRTAIPYLRKDGAKDARLVLVLGENAGGKSFFRRLTSVAVGKPNKIRKDTFPVEEFIHLSMEGRCGGMYGPMAAMVYGSEQWDSTGQNSGYTVRMGIKTATERDHDLVLYWDEPDLGMSNACAAGAGVAIREFLTTAPPTVKAVFITTHNTALVQQLAPLDPHYVYLGNTEGPATLDEWLSAPVVPVPLENLETTARQRFKDIQAILNENQKKNR